MILGIHEAPGVMRGPRRRGNKEMGLARINPCCPANFFRTFHGGVNLKIRNLSPKFPQRSSLAARCRKSSRLQASPFQALVAFLPITANLLVPFQAAVGVGCFVGLKLVEARFAAGYFRLFAGMGR